MKRRDNEKQSGKYDNRKCDNRGTSMATVIVSFALLLLFAVSYFKVQRLVSNMMMSSKDMAVNNSELIKAYYLEETADLTVADRVRLNFQGEEGSFFIEATLNRATKEGLNGSIYYFADKTVEIEE